MKKVKALVSFDHDGEHQVGDVFEVTNATAEDLEKAQLVEVVSDSDTEDEKGDADASDSKSKSRKTKG